MGRLFKDTYIHKHRLCVSQVWNGEAVLHVPASPTLLCASWSNVLSASTGLGSDFLSHHFVYEVEKAHDQV